MTTLKETRQELFEVFAQNNAGKPQSWLPSSVKKIFKYEPFAKSLVAPACITIFTGGLDPDRENNRVELRIYVKATSDDSGPQDTIDDVIEAIEFGKVVSGMKFSYIPSQFGATEWEITFDDRIGYWCAIGKLARGRNDF